MNDELAELAEKFRVSIKEEQFNQAILKIKECMTRGDIQILRNEYGQFVTKEEFIHVEEKVRRIPMLLMDYCTKEDIIHKLKILSNETA